ncbi:hypothetical protein SARC_12656 [Sphaeroforma arctica JP610]|uniref:Uncharacterized protein n=1 Tax=Sphaeroforma arctica JP610 TaxID=667725 RepID=A0A0L0FDF7_9EUKA|nr:hypothetical protein SARC_12656 [Sphaeroforma arctica JP610]KNC74804.1 hypothetical protein SARC_12656 [Sphaeroforma arctica JP610]|eukprot:XP_014148706.1 hypothetical protein SARC_12656 [Sphaeroforma arctica JP610]
MVIDMDLAGNSDLTQPPPEIVIQGTRAVLEYLSERDDDATGEAVTTAMNDLSVSPSANRNPENSSEGGAHQSDHLKQMKIFIKEASGLDISVRKIGNSNAWRVLMRLCV